MTQFVPVANNGCATVLLRRYFVSARIHLGKSGCADPSVILSNFKPSIGADPGIIISSRA